MDLSYTPQEEAFRAEVRSFLAQQLPQRLSNKVRHGIRLARKDMEDWHAILHNRGWLGNHWPREHGGPGWSAVEKSIFEDECAFAHAPRIVPFGVNMLGPVLIKYGNDAQKRHWLPRILDGTDWWCQGYSEPGAGSDLAAVMSSAVRGNDAQGEHYVVNGQKTWTTYGHYADKIFCLVRTDRNAKKQAGISLLLIDMASPGIEVRPILTLDGVHEVNEVFLTNVRVPLENLVGEENQGWTCAKYLLTYERTNIAGVGLSMAALERLRAASRQVMRNSKPMAEDPSFAARVAKVEIDLDNMKTTNLRVIASVAGGGVPGAESSMLKIRGTEIRQEIASLLRRAMGSHASAWRIDMLEGDYGDHRPPGPPDAMAAASFYFNNRKLSIYGGSNEVQRNIVAKSILGL